jgi:hypothetical protein
MNPIDLQSHCFTGSTFEGWQDIYHFSVACRPETLVSGIASFYEGRKARPTTGSTTLTFQRGRRIWSYFCPGFETWPLQKITVDIQPEEANRTKVTIVYDVPGWFIRYPPFGLKKEVEGLLEEIRQQNSSDGRLTSGTGDR